MNWGDFKKAVEAAGVKDEDEISYIDEVYFDKGEKLSVSRDTKGKVIFE